MTTAEVPSRDEVAASVAMAVLGIAAQPEKEEEEVLAAGFGDLCRGSQGERNPT